MVLPIFFMSCSLLRVLRPVRSQIQPGHFSGVSCALSTLLWGRERHSVSLTYTHHLLVSSCPPRVVSEGDIVPSTAQSSWLPVTAQIKRDVLFARERRRPAFPPTPSIPGGPCERRSLGFISASPLRPITATDLPSPHFGVNFVLCLLREIFWVELSEPWPQSGLLEPLCACLSPR